MFLIDHQTKKPIVNNQTTLPPCGRYLSEIVSVDVCDVPAPNKNFDFCWIIEHTLTNTETLATYSFTETLFPSGANTRGRKFLYYLKRYFPDLEQIYDLEGTREELYISWDVHGGYVYPFICNRFLVAKSPIYEKAYNLIPD